MTRKYECIKRFSWTDENLYKLRTLSKKVTQLEAAKIIGCHIHTLQKACCDFEVSFRKYGASNHSAKLSFEDCELIRDLADEGFKQYEIAAKFDIDRSRVSRIVNYKSRLTC